MRQGYGSDCNLDKSWQVSSNKVFSRDGQLTVCGMPWDQWVKSGKTRDTGTTLGKWPSDGQLVAWARQLLGFRSSAPEQIFI
mmetsp:Transcript_65443/g.212964  ORF Transcript_65443/g.212964 Transcript_65443/m.212964 type:complete len:82 (-) Transcript_65443:319-564(-)